MYDAHYYRNGVLHTESGYADMWLAVDDLLTRHFSKAGAAYRVVSTVSGETVIHPEALAEMIDQEDWHHICEDVSPV